MPDATPEAWSDPLAGLFAAGTCAGRSDGELLERFRSARDEASERAFEALVVRHGPMVLGTCRHLLDDPADVHDAFQAVFLVLARRAGAIRKSESVGSWLYGVTVRVAARAHSIRRRVRERRVLEAASSAALDPRSPPASPAGFDDGAATVHEEVARLPDRYRTPIVLCYFEGMTHDEAAARLGWPVGTVRSRLARARDRLRARLTRRGLADPSTIAPMAARLLAGPSSAATLMPLPVQAPVSLARAAIRPAAGSLSSTSVALADGVLTTMMMKKLVLAACLIAPLGIGTGAGALLWQRAGAQQTPAPAEPASRKPATETKAPKPAESDRLLERVIAAARRRLDASKAYYVEGRTTLDRYIAAAESFERVELLAARSDDQRAAIRRRHLELLKDIHQREQAALQVGRGTVADEAEAAQALAEAEFEMEVGARQDAEKAALLRRVADLERKVEQLQRGRGGRDR